ncbi:MAG: ABC transporter permease, partial [Sphaerotilus sp.]|nr:ABC transporter permease [Sphaerotilus sp.]
MFRLEARPQPSKAMSLASPLIALVLTTIIGIALFALLGKDPVKGLQVFFVEPLKNARALSELSVKAVPLVLIALGLAVCFRSNLWNIGAEGQFIVGALAGGWVALQAQPDSSRG